MAKKFKALPLVIPTCYGTATSVDKDLNRDFQGKDFILPQNPLPPEERFCIRKNEFLKGYYRGGAIHPCEHFYIFKREDGKPFISANLPVLNFHIGFRMSKTLPSARDTF